MRKIWILVVAIVLCFVCLTSCSSDDTDDSNNTTNGDTNNSNTSTDINTGNVDVVKFDLHNVENLQCEISFGQTGEKFIFEKEKALQLYSIIANCDYTKLDGMPIKSSVNPSKDYVYLHFTGDKYSEEFPTKEYGHFTIYIDDIVAHNLSIYMSSIHYYQYEDGLYDQVCQYIVENSMDDKVNKN